MKFQTRILKPRAGTFFGVFTLSIIIMFSFRALIPVFKSPNAFELKFEDWWIIVALLAIGNAAGVTLGARKHQLSITDVDDLEKVRGWALEFLLDNGARITKQKENETTLESVKRFNRLFNNWFGMELISVKRVENKILVEGHTRWVEGLKNSIQSQPRLGVNTF